MIGDEALLGMWVEHAWARKPALGYCKHALPRQLTLLAAAAKNVPPHANHAFPEHAEAVQISGYCVVVEVALQDCAEPFASVRHGVVHARTELLLDLSQLRPHTLADRHAPYGKTSVPAFSANVRKARKSNVSGLPSPLRARFCSAKRPNSIKRVLSGWSSSPNFDSRS